MKCIKVKSKITSEVYFWIVKDEEYNLLKEYNNCVEILECVEYIQYVKQTIDNGYVSKEDLIKNGYIEGEI